MERNKQLKIIQAVNTELSELKRQRNVYLNLLHEDISGDAEVERREERRDRCRQSPSEGVHLLDCTKVQEGEKKKRHRCQWKDVDCPKDGVTLERNCMECEHFPDNEGKENFNNEPRQVIQVADFYGSFPACPACHEPAYDDTRCHFCGQPYTWPEPDPEDRPTIKGGHYAENGEVVCDACGCADLQFVYHADGKDRYGDGYNCAKCGAVVQMIFKRR